MGWFSRLIGRERLERELDAELTHHVDEEARRLEREGLEPDDARRQALARFGGLEPIKEHARDARGTRWVDDLSRDVRYAFRMMRRSPVFTAAAIVSLAVGIGANAAIFSISDALLLRPLDLPRPNELWFLNRAGFAQPNYRFSYPSLTNLQKAVPDVQFAASASTNRIQIDRESGAELAIGQLVSGNWFEVLGVSAATGRLLTGNDATAPGTSPVAVLSYDFWSREYGTDPRVVGSTLRVNGVPLTIVGVAARNFDGVNIGTRVDLWAPVTMQQELRSRGNASIDDADGTKPWVTQEGIAWLTVVARIPASVRPAEAGARIAGYWKTEVEDRADMVRDEAQRKFRLREHAELVPGARGLSTLRDNFSQPLVVLMVTVAAVLLIACANLASLLLARSSARGREFALRLSLGAGRGRVVRQLLTESLTLAFLGGLAGLGVAQLGGHGLLVMASTGSRAIPLDLPLDWRLIAFTAAVSVVTGVLFGLGPALRSARPSLVEPLKGGTRVVGAERKAGTLPFGKILIALQVALSFVLLVGALLFLRTFQNLLNVDTGFDRTEVVVAAIDPVLSGVTTGQLPDLYARLIERARAIPGATSAALALSGPVSGSARTSSISVDAEAMRVGKDSDVREEYVTPDYLTTVGMPLIRGRSFTADDRDGRPKVCVVNESMAKHFFGSVDPIGHHLGYGSPTDVEVIGVVHDARVDGPKGEVPWMVFYPIAQSSPVEFARGLYVRVSGPVEAAKSSLRSSILSVNPRLAVREITTLAVLNERTVSNDRLVSRLTGVFGLLAMGVACLGLYGTVAYSVVRRTNEIGVRMALGASRGGVGWLVLRETLTLAAAGGVLGMIVVWPLLKFLTSLLYGISPHDPVALASAAGGLLVAGALAGAIPAWRASRVDPLTALRAE